MVLGGGTKRKKENKKEKNKKGQKSQHSGGWPVGAWQTQGASGKGRAGDLLD